MQDAAFRCGTLPSGREMMRGGLLKLWGAGRRVLRLSVAIAMNARALKLPRPSLLIDCGKLPGSGPGRAGGLRRGTNE